MLSVKKKVEVIGVYFVLLFSLIACREISSKIHRDGISTIKRAISFEDLQNDQVEDSRGMEEGRNTSHLENVERNILRRDTDYARRDEKDLAENRTTLTDDGKKLLSPNKIRKTHKKTQHTEKKAQAKILRKVNRENSLLSANLEKRKIRSVNNTTDYYAQRKAVMDAYYARRREIAAKYGRKRNNIEVTNNRNIGYWFKNDTSTAPPPNNNPTLEVSRELNNLDTITLNSHVRKPAVGDIAIYSPPTTRNCTNASLSGPLPRKSRQDDEEDDEDEIEEIIDENSIFSNRQNTVGSGDQTWGSCSGSLVYQHNLFLNLKGPSNLDTIFEVIMDGPICITCVKALRYNRTRAQVSLDSGGRGYEYAKLKLKGYENEGFSYIVQIWGVRKTDDDCSRQL